jgi:hypothetical protein
VSKNDKDYRRGRTESEVAINIRMDIDRLDYKALTEFQKLPANLRAALDGVTSLNYQVQARFNRDGKYLPYKATEGSQVKEPEPILAYSPKACKVMDHVRKPDDFSDWNGSEEFAKLGVGVRDESQTKSVYGGRDTKIMDQNKAKRKAANAKLWPFKQALMQFYRHKLTECIPDLHEPWTKAQVKIWDTNDDVYDGHCAADAFKDEVIARVRETYKAEQAPIILTEVK